MKISTKITCAFLIAISATIGVAIASHTNIGKVNETRKWVEHTLEVIIQKENLQASISDLESRCRAYAASGNERFLDGTLDLKTTINRDCENLLRLTDDNPKQKANLAPLSGLLAQRIQQLDRLVEEGKKADAGKIGQYFRTPDSGSNWQYSNILETVKAEEERLLRLRTAETLKSIDELESTVYMLAGLSTLVVGAIAAYLVIGISNSIRTLVEGASKIGQGQLDFCIPVAGKDEISVLARAFNHMIEQLRQFRDAQVAREWQKTHLNRFAILLQGVRDLEKAAGIVLNELVPLLGAHHAAVYVFNSDSVAGPHLHLAGTYACLESESDLPRSLKLGEGLVGQCAADGKKMILHDVESGSFTVKTALTQSKPFEVVLLPLVYENETLGIVEIASLNEFTQVQHAFIDELAIWMGPVINAVRMSSMTDLLLSESQELNEELQAQQEELETQQEELRVVNEELEDKAEELDLQNQEIVEKNEALEKMQYQLADRAEELAAASKYKSEFLANMSHDLRTPLNSLLIFSEILAENDDKNLQDFQVEYAKNIHAAGKTLLSLIDDILDLSKIESGTVSLDVVQIPVANILADLRRNFEMAASNKGVQFVLKANDDVPPSIKTDYKRLLQLLTNLLSNAFKFTAQGSVCCLLEYQAPQGNSNDPGNIVFTVSDTGIGIAQDKQEIVFQAFRQADRDIKSKYGGTGLGLAICRQLSELLGGSISLKSEPGQGSTFTVILPVAYEAGKRPVARVQKMFATAGGEDSEERIQAIMSSDVDDRRNIQADDRVLLMIEDDATFAKMLLEMARKQDFKGVTAFNGRDGLQLARHLKPDGITLDLKLPDMAGWAVLDQLKSEPETRHIPVHIISIDSEQLRGLELGAIGFLEKPVTKNTLTDAINKIKQMITRETARILVVEQDDDLRRQFSDLMSENDVIVSAVATGEDALSRVKDDSFDCIIVDFRLADMNADQFIERMQSGTTARPPVVVYSAENLSSQEKSLLHDVKRVSVVKEADTPERVLSEVLLFLHRVESSLPDSKRKLLAKARQSDSPLAGRKILIVDDDPRNIAAMKGVLQRHKLDLLYSENGRQAIECLHENPDIDLVLMDMMMPELDGYEAMKLIRQEARFVGLPIIAVTAKAMKEDRRKCLEAGASDYIAKPVDKAQLLSLLRVWLYQA